MDVLAVVHQDDAPPGTFADVTKELGHRLDTRSFAAGNPPPSGAADSYDAVMIFGASAQVDQDEEHPWLPEARAFASGLVERQVPLLGVCFGAQLIAQTAGAAVGPAVVPEVGWHPVVLTSAGQADPVLGPGPHRFAAYQGHSYGFTLPAGATPLAQGTGDALQAYRLGPAAWGLQFHPEVTWAIVDSWIAEHARDGDVDDEAVLREETRANLPEWTAFGRALCERFLAVAGGAR